MPYFPDEVVEHILGFVSSHRDRNAASLVCHAWYRVEGLTRRSVFISNCYAVRPERVHARFPCLRSLTVKGRPCFADFNLVPAGWGATAEPWVDACARTCPGLEELRLKRMVITDDCLNHLARSFPNLRSLVLVSCEGFSTDGLATIATNCRFLKELDLHGSQVEFRGPHWFSCFPKPSTSLESLNFACLDGTVSANALESLVARSPNLKSLRLNRAVPAAVLANILTSAPKLVDLGTGLVAQNNNADALSLYNAIQQCSSLNSLSGFWDSPRWITPVIHYICKNLTCLNLSYAPTFQTADLIGAIRHCQNLRHLWVLDHIGDAGLKVVASCCLELQELRVFPANADVLASTDVTEEGLVAVSSGCRKLSSVLYSCSRMTNSALITVAKNCSRITSFRLRICLHGSVDAVTGQPLDEGFGAIVRSCKGLRRLSMSGLLTDSVFLYIGMYAERLETLSVAFAGDSDDGMIYVLNGCKNLRKLEMRNCPFGDTALLAGMHRYEAMRSLWMSSCDITLGGCRSLAATMPNLNVEVVSQVDGVSCDAKKVEKLYVYRTLAGPRGDAPGFVSAL
ncbi:transport inhibitor response 1-like protein Os11g0515500 [Hordeum vulgare subsp. vulgare]|uniref:F-box domain-containing protein n=1 Tax=Hordeum vulgare subsp. vulgare TaxID=112509 RepID=M0WJ49_HORVV|nr:transport inhibitor response 1-like protein Os11g0515500 [Hordeum vulgare subsp. vulgare]